MASPISYPSSNPIYFSIFERNIDLYVYTLHIYIYIYISSFFAGKNVDTTISQDPWNDFALSELPVEIATRHRYNALKQKWVVDQVTVKVENEVPVNL